MFVSHYWFVCLGSTVGRQFEVFASLLLFYPRKYQQLHLTLLTFSLSSACVSDWRSSETEMELETEVFLEDYVVAVGDSLDLQCNAPNFLMSVTWQKDGSIVLPGNRTRLSHKALHVNNVSYDDSGVYSCRYEQGKALLGNYTVRVTGQYTVHVFHFFFAFPALRAHAHPNLHRYVGKRRSTLFYFSHKRPYSSCLGLQRFD